MEQVVLEIPDSVNNSDVKMAVGAMHYNRMILTSGQSAELVGMNTRTFLENLGKFSASIFGESSEPTFPI